MDGGSITEIGNTKRGEGGWGWDHELFGIAGSAEFLCYSRSDSSGSEEHGFVAQATDLGLQI